MAVKINTQTGMIEISNDVIATVVGGAVTDVFGIVGMASKKQRQYYRDFKKRKLFTRRRCTSRRERNRSRRLYDRQLRHENLRSIAQCPRKSEIQFGDDAWSNS